MMRNIHFFNLKDGADEESALHFINVTLKEHAMAHGCIERRTLKLIDAREGGEEVDGPQYMNGSW